MAIEMNCPHCNQLMLISEKYAGNTVSCERCEERLLVPAESDGYAANPKISSSFSADNLIWMALENDQMHGPISAKQFLALLQQDILSLKASVSVLRYESWEPITEFPPLHEYLKSNMMKSEHKQYPHESQDDSTINADLHEWEALENNQRHGPLTAVQLLGLVKKGALSSNALASIVGENTWKPIIERPDLKGRLKLLGIDAGHRRKANIDRQTNRFSYRRRESGNAAKIAQRIFDSVSEKMRIIIFSSILIAVVYIAAAYLGPGIKSAINEGTNNYHERNAAANKSNETDHNPVPKSGQSTANPEGMSLAECAALELEIKNKMATIDISNANAASQEGKRRDIEIIAASRFYYYSARSDAWKDATLLSYEVVRETGDTLEMHFRFKLVFQHKNNVLNPASRKRVSEAITLRATFKKVFGNWRAESVTKL